MVGNCILDDKICCEAANQEIIRRYYHCLCDLKRGNSSKEILYKLQLLMKQGGLTINDRPVVKAAMQRDVYKRQCKNLSINSFPRETG